MGHSKTSGHTNLTFVLIFVVSKLHFLHFQKARPVLFPSTCRWGFAEMHKIANIGFIANLYSHIIAVSLFICNIGC